MKLAIALLVVSGVIGLGLLYYGTRNLTRASKWAQFLQAIFSLLALTLAAYWYFVERKGMPHADVSQSVDVVPVGNGLVAIEAHVTVRNLGERVLRISRIQSYLQNVEPDTFQYGALAQVHGDDYWRAQRPDAAGPQFDAAELRWPVARRFAGPVNHEIEPGETDLISITFLLPCSSVRHVRVATDVFKPAGESEQELAWKARSFVDLCAQCCPTTSEGE